MFVNNKNNPAAFDKCNVVYDSSCKHVGWLVRYWNILSQNNTYPNPVIFCHNVILKTFILIILNRFFGPACINQDKFDVFGTYTEINSDSNSSYKSSDFRLNSDNLLHLYHQNVMCLYNKVDYFGKLTSDNSYGSSNWIWVLWFHLLIFLTISVLTALIELTYKCC